MKSASKLIFIVFLVLSLSCASIISINLISSKDYIQHSVEEELTRTSEFQQKYILSFFDDLNMDIDSFANFLEVKEIFQKELIPMKDVAKKDANKNLNIISKEIENYLIANPDLTLDDLQKNTEFKKIAVQKISSDGYSVIYDAKTGEILFHPDQRFIDNGIEFLKDVAPQFYNDSRRILSGNESSVSGFYELLDINNISREKFAVHKKIPIKTSDNYELVIATTVYVDSYLGVESVDLNLYDYVSKLVNLNNYEGIYFINNNGSIIWDYDPEGFTGLNAANLDDSLGSLFDYFSTKNSSVVAGPNFESHGDGSITFSVGRNIYNGNKFIGVIIAEFSADEIYNVLSNEGDDNLYRESYLVNSDGLLASPIKFSTGDILVQEILTDNVAYCLLGDSSKNKFILSNNYMGDKIISTYKSVDDLCLIRDALYDENVNTLYHKKKIQIILITFFIFLGIILILIFIKMYIGKRYSFTKKSGFEYFKLNNNILNKITPRSAILFGGILSIGGIFILYSLYGYLYPEVYQESVMDLVIVLLASIILGQSIKIKRLADKNLLFFGSLIVIFEKCVEVVVQTIEITQSLEPNLILWTLIYLVKYFGFILIINGFFRRFSR